jgi:7-carboxy-7-deazaguanine synthase
MSRAPTRDLRISEIFLSLQGESRTVGLPTVFIRLTGCPLRCRWCDTAYAFAGGERLTVDQVVAAVAAFDVEWVTVTGGEPLAQPGCHELLRRLCDRGWRVSLETSGALDLSLVDPRVARVMDLKAPGSGEAGRNRWENLALLRADDQVKVVIGDRQDYEWAKRVLARHELASRCELLFSPVHGGLAPETLAQWILEDRLPVRFQIQLHKYLWGDVPGR